jgi:plastocyanin domain-containing protein
MRPEIQRTTTLPLLLLLFAVGCAEAHATPPRHHAPRLAPAQATPPAPAQRVAVTADASGYHPATVQVASGRPVTLVFTRTSDQGCGQQVVLPAQDLRRDLPLNQPVEVTLTPRAGTIAFTCGMNMLRGSIVAR